MGGLSKGLLLGFEAKEVGEGGQEGLFVGFVVSELEVFGGPNAVDDIDKFVKDVLVEEKHHFNQQTAYFSLSLQVFHEFLLFLGTEDAVGLDDVCQRSIGQC